MTQERKATVLFVSSNKTGKRWVYFVSQDDFKCFDSLYRVEQYADEQLELDVIDVVHFFTTTGKFKKEKKNPYLFSSREELIKMAKQYRKMYKEHYTTHYQLMLAQWDADRFEKRVLDYKKKLEDYMDKASKWDDLQRLLTK